MPPPWKAKSIDHETCLLRLTTIFALSFRQINTGLINPIKILRREKGSLYL